MLKSKGGCASVIAGEEEWFRGVVSEGGHTRHTSDAAAGRGRWSARQSDPFAADDAEGVHPPVLGARHDMPVVVRVAGFCLVGAAGEAEAAVITQ